MWTLLNTIGEEIPLGIKLLAFGRFIDKAGHTARVFSIVQTATNLLKRIKVKTKVEHFFSLRCCSVLAFSIQYGAPHQWGSSRRVARKYFSVLPSIPALQGVSRKHVHHEATGSLHYQLHLVTVKSSRHFPYRF